MYGFKKVIANKNQLSRHFFSSERSLWIENILKNLFHTQPLNAFAKHREINHFFKKEIDLFIRKKIPKTTLKIFSGPLDTHNPCLFLHLHDHIKEANVNNKILKVYEEPKHDRLCILTKVFDVAVFFSLPMSSDLLDEENEPGIIYSSSKDGSTDKSYKLYTKQFCEKFEHIRLKELSDHIDKIQKWLNANKNYVKLLRLLSINLINYQPDSKLLKKIMSYIKTKNTHIYQKLVSEIIREAIKTKNKPLFEYYLPEIKKQSSTKYLIQSFNSAINP